MKYSQREIYLFYMFFSGSKIGKKQKMTKHMYLNTIQHGQWAMAEVRVNLSMCHICRKIGHNGDQFTDHMRYYNKFTSVLGGREMLCFGSMS
jgi:antirestriction protein ArdC